MIFKDFKMRNTISALCFLLVLTAFSQNRSIEILGFTGLGAVNLHHSSAKISIPDNGGGSLSQSIGGGMAIESRVYKWFWLRGEIGFAEFRNELPTGIEVQYPDFNMDLRHFQHRASIGYLFVAPELRFGKDVSFHMRVGPALATAFSSRYESGFVILNGNDGLQFLDYDELETQTRHSLMWVGDVGFRLPIFSEGTEIGIGLRYTNLTKYLGEGDGRPIGSYYIFYPQISVHSINYLMSFGLTF